MRPSDLTSEKVLKTPPSAVDPLVKTVIHVTNIKESIANARIQVIMLNGVIPRTVILSVPEPFISDNLLCTKDGIFMLGQDTANFIAERKRRSNNSRFFKQPQRVLRYLNSSNVEILGSPYYKGVSLPRIPSVCKPGMKSRMRQYSKQTLIP